jgi:hypothetical protein
MAEMNKARTVKVKSPSIDYWFNRNQKINAAYAELFLAHPTLFTWPGLAAFASYQGKRIKFSRLRIPL